MHHSDYLRSTVVLGCLASFTSGAVLSLPKRATCSATDQSCGSTTNVDTCCTNSPGGQMLQTQFWDTTDGPSTSWTIHGRVHSQDPAIDPDNCDGTFDSNCDTARAYTNITAILKAGGASTTLSYMNTYWVSNSGTAESFWEHEWGKHGTCISTLEPSCYGSSYTPQEEVVDFFEQTVALFKTVPTYDWLAAAGIVPSTSKTYTLAQLQAVANSKFGQDAIWNCDSGNLNEVWYQYHTIGPVKSGKFVPAVPVGSKSTCASTGIKYPPKSGSSTPTTGSTSATSSSTSAPSGSVFVNVVTSSGSTTGCLISAGVWYVGGTCAAYSVTNSGSNFALKTSKGACAVSSAGVLSCASGNTASTFSSSGGYITYNGQSTFYAASVPSGSTQVAVQTNTAAQAIQLKTGPTS